VCFILFVQTAEIELLDMLIQTCRAVQNTRNPRRRLDLVVPAAQWEMEFRKRRNELVPEPKAPSGKRPKLEPVS
jgi:hypothetical protein